ncbi:hypothetical protein Ahu01nite_025970 [Winogradskya humida]|uniref:Uncharacterized protein n=1 Tax=Winogradskya humida TaxID=113566 RepID=A0ABQ3ZLN8_9ACTN|nr:hypothetical protein Ahu01nite_025970 [Actinoplanes humidus]
MFVSLAFRSPWVGAPPDQGGWVRGAKAPDNRAEGREQGVPQFSDRLSAAFVAMKSFERALVCKARPNIFQWCRRTTV